ncbi:hypothetical protein GCM10027589_36250 [Actinocorallia lasiicapitis]
MGQGRVNELINGRREISQLDVFERIANGLTMPDDARALLGLAPAHAATSGDLAGHAEIGQVFARQGDAAHELQAAAAQASEIRILAVRGLGLLALNDALLRGPLLSRATPANVQVLLLDPDAPILRTRAEEVGEAAASFAAGIRLAVARLGEMAGHSHVDLEVRLYDSLPVWRMMSFDATMYLGSFGPHAEGHRSTIYKLTAAADGVLHTGHLRQFDDQWRRGRPA